VSSRVKGLILPVAFLIVAELAFRYGGLEGDALASPTQTVVAFVNAVLDGTLIQATGQTLISALTGLAIGGGLGLFVAILLGLFAPLARLMRVSIEAFRPIPSIALLPIALLFYGFGYRMEISIISFACFWPILIIGEAAISNIEPRLIEVSRMLHLSFAGRVFKIVLPAALPRLFVAFRLAAAVSVIVAVTVEIAVNPIGLGFQLMDAHASLRPETMMAFLVWIGFIGWGLNELLMWSQRRLFGRMGGVEVTQ
jgi:ABC-type nitrate/sulfonate/bicarbonate transport system permease component